MTSYLLPVMHGTLTVGWEHPSLGPNLGVLIVVVLIHGKSPIKLIS
jgi:hypothetical protein